MTVDFVDLKENITVADAINRIRSIGVDKETVDTCFVLDLNRKLLGQIGLRELILSDPNEIIGNIMEDNVVTTTTLTDQEEVAQLFGKYDLNLMPVVDSENRLVGIITVDDIVDIMEQEATEDMEMMAAIVALEALKEPCTVVLSTDSQYVRQGITQWIHNWKKRGWKTADKKPVKNVDLWKRLDTALGKHEIRWEWVKGHAGHPENERCDELARTAANSPTQDDVGYQPEA